MTANDVREPFINLPLQSKLYISYHLYFHELSNIILMFKNTEFGLYLSTEIHKTCKRGIPNGTVKSTWNKLLRHFKKYVCFGRMGKWKNLHQDKELKTVMSTLLQS